MPDFSSKLQVWVIVSQHDPTMYFSAGLGWSIKQNASTFNGVEMTSYGRLPPGGFWEKIYDDNDE